MKKWATEFKCGRESIEDDEKSGRPKDATTDENVEIVQNLVMCDRRQDLRSIASEVGISFGAVQTTLMDILGMPKVSARWVPRMLTDDQKRSWLDISKYLLHRHEDDPSDFIDRVETQDVIWVHHFDSETKMQSMQWKDPGSPPDIRGVIMIDYLEQGRTINGACYAAGLKALAPGNCEKEERNIDSRCSSLAGQCACSHVAKCHDCCD